MGLLPRTRNQLTEEGITSASDLAEFDKESMKQVAENLRRPGGRVADPDPNSAAGATIPTPPFTFGAKTQLRLNAATEIVRYYETVGRELTAANLQWHSVIKNFDVHWKALKARKSDENPDVPKITKSLVVTQWSEAFVDFLQRKIGCRMILLSFVIRPENAVPVIAPPLARGQPFSTDHGSVEGELVARASHTHALFRDDNALVYYLLEEATRDTTFSASIKPFQRNKNGREAWMAIIRQYAGTDKWEAELKAQDDLLHNRLWKGQSSFTLEKFIAQHRHAFVSMQQCAVHVSFQLPNERTRVTFLLDAIQCNDPPLQASMALVRNDDAATGKMNNFENTASFLLPHDPVAKKRTSTGKRGSAEISHTSSDKPSLKSGIGRTGVHLRFHDYKEYKHLNQEQKEELEEHRNVLEKQTGSRKLPKNPSKKQKLNPGHSKKTSPGGKVNAKMISAAIAKALKERDTVAKSNEKDMDDARSYIMSLFSKDNKTSKEADVSASNTSSSTSAVKLTKILKGAKSQLK